MAEKTGRDALLAALEVRQAVRRSILIGTIVAVGVTVFFLGLVAGGRTEAPLWFYPGLAFVVFATVSMLATAILVGRRVLRLAVHPGAVVRRTATGGLVGGLLWLAAAAGLILGPGGIVLVEVALPWAALLSVFGLWSVYTRYKRLVPWRRVFAGAAILGLLGAVIMADLAAFDLVELLGVTGRGPTGAVVRLFNLGAAGLVGSLTLMAAFAVVGARADPAVHAILTSPAIVGVLIWGQTGPGRFALVGLGVGLGLAWSGACWRLRRVENTSVPSGADPLL